jgi:hypothetical protein
LRWRKALLSGRRLTTTRACGLRATLLRAQAFLKQLVLMLQLLVLAGELPQLVLKLLDPHFRIAAIIRLRKRLRTKRKHRGECHDTRNSMEFG